MKKYIILKQVEGRAPRETFALVVSEENLQREIKRLVEHSSLSYSIFEAEKIGVIATSPDRSRDFYPFDFPPK